MKHQNVGSGTLREIKPCKLTGQKNVYKHEDPKERYQWVQTFFRLLMNAR
jgi:hypothetical protein